MLCLPFSLACSQKPRQGPIAKCTYLHLGLSWVQSFLSRIDFCLFCCRPVPSSLLYWSSFLYRLEMMLNVLHKGLVPFQWGPARCIICSESHFISTCESVWCFQHKVTTGQKTDLPVRAQGDDEYSKGVGLGRALLWKAGVKFWYLQWREMRFSDCTPHRALPGCRALSSELIACLSALRFRRMCE